MDYLVLLSICHRSCSLKKKPFAGLSYWTTVNYHRKIFAYPPILNIKNMATYKYYIIQNS